MTNRKQIGSTGIGYAGIDGAWWQPALAPFSAPLAVQRELQQIGSAIFLFLDLIADLYGTEQGEQNGLNTLLRHKTPHHLQQWSQAGRVEMLRPDFQLALPKLDGEGWHPVATELEISPSAHGFAHAMQVGYALPLDLAESFARYLAGRQFLLVGSQQWSEFLIEQLAFCRALEQFGATGRLLYDLPLQQLAASIQRGERWQPPIFGVPSKPPGWNDDLLARLQAADLLRFGWPADDVWPTALTNTVIFRFGYLECFAPEKLQAFVLWQESGADLLIPTSFVFEHKGVMAALGLPGIRQMITARQPQALAVLDRCIPETLLLREDVLPRLLAERPQWVLKFAGFDQSNQSWGGRSLQIGAKHTEDSWQKVLHEYLALPFPVVAQRFTPSLRLDIDYFDQQDQVRTLRQGDTRLRVFLLRQGQEEAIPCGAHLTVSGEGEQVSESISAVQSPVVFLAR